MKHISILLAIIALIAGGSWATAQAEDQCLTVDAPGCMFGLPAPMYQQLLAQMQANPAPDVTQVDVDRKEINSYSFFKVMPDTEIFDAPNGNVVGKMDNGFTFVTIRGI